MSRKSTVTETCYCSCCGWLEAGDAHEWQKHPKTIHGTVAEVRKRYQNNQLPNQQ